MRADAARMKRSAIFKGEEFERFDREGALAELLEVYMFVWSTNSEGMKFALLRRDSGDILFTINFNQRASCSQPQTLAQSS